MGTYGEKWKHLKRELGDSDTQRFPHMNVKSILKFEKSQLPYWPKKDDISLVT